MHAYVLVCIGGLPVRGGKPVAAALSLQLPMVCVAVLSGDGGDEKRAPAPALHLPHFGQ